MEEPMTIERAKRPVAAARMAEAVLSLLDAFARTLLVGPLRPITLLPGHR
jgi:hypothetical protein